MRLPRPCRFLARRFILASELGIGEALSGHLHHCKMEAVSIVQRIIFRGAIVEPENLLTDIAVEMERLNGNIGSAQRSLQQAPEVFDALCVDFAAHILFDVVHSFVYVCSSRQSDCRKRYSDP